jgi:signal transduction histidine kinase
MSTFVNVADSERGVLRPSTEVEHGLFGVVRLTLQTHQRQTDAIVAGVLLALSTVWLVLSPFSGPKTALVQAALVVPLIWRRSHPTTVFLVVAALGLAQWALDYRLIGDIALLAALYTVAAHESRLRAVIATGILEVGAAMAATRWVPAGTAPRSFLFLSAMVCAALFAGLTVRSGSAYMGWLAERAERLEVERDQQAAIGAATERARIAREMHDIVAHSLAVVITLADAATVVMTSEPTRAIEAMHQVSDVGREALSDMRAMIGVLRTEEPGPGLDPQPTIAQLGDLFDRVRVTGLDVKVEVVGEPFPLGAALELSVYRILQEAMTNTIKHAAATTSQIVVCYQQPLINLTVSDNGSPGSIGRSGHGIEGMSERAKLHGGSLDAGPGPSGGWVVSAVLRTDTARLNS